MCFLTRVYSVCVLAVIADHSKSGRFGGKVKARHGFVHGVSSWVKQERYECAGLKSEPNVHIIRGAQMLGFECRLRNSTSQTRDFALLRSKLTHFIVASLLVTPFPSLLLGSRNRPATLQAIVIVIVSDIRQK